MTRTIPNDPFADFQPTARDDEDAQSRRMLESITEMSETPGSGIAMCHRQGKTAVYLSDDETKHHRTPAVRTDHTHAVDGRRHSRAMTRPKLTVVNRRQRCG